MMVIKAIDYIESGFSADDANSIIPIIEECLNNNDQITIDFSKVKYYTTLFFNLAITSLITKLGGVDQFNHRVKLVKLSKAGKETYEHSLQNAIEILSLDEEDKNALETFIDDELK